MKKIYILILFFALFIQTTNSQYSNSSGYFPLQVGNTWMYKRFQLPAAEYSFLKVTITKDTVVNNIRYYYLHHTPEQSDYWMRFDTTDGILYQHYDFNVPYIKLSAGQGDTMNFICSGSFDTTFFNTQTTLKKFYKHSSVPHSSSGIDMDLTKNFGQTYYLEYSASFTGSSYLYAWLTGCIINGVMYGDTSSVIGVSQINSHLPVGFTLSQNYPNPFNPTTKIKFAISGVSAAHTFLSVYDILGNEMAVLVNQNLIPGEYEVEWNASDIPSGIYFYKIQAGEFSETKKMVLIK